MYVCRAKIINLPNITIRAMEKITLLARTTRKGGEIRIRFRLTDGRKADIFHKTDIRATASDLEKFDKSGMVKPKAKVYNRDLADKIIREINKMHKVYSEMREGGYDLTSPVFEELFNRGQQSTDSSNSCTEENLLSLFNSYSKRTLADGIVGGPRYKHLVVVQGKLERFLKIIGRTQVTPKQFDENMLMEFRSFLFEEYRYVDQYPDLYSSFTANNIPSSRLSMNTVAGQLKILQAFFATVEGTYVSRSPFEKLGRDRKRVAMKTYYDDPYFLRASEFHEIMKADVPESLRSTKDAFLLHCALGCRISDFQSLKMDNLGVSEDGIPYVHYLPKKTKMSQVINKEKETPLVRFAFDIIMRTQFDIPEIRYASGKSGYNKKIKALLNECGIDRKVAVFNEETMANEYKPLFEIASSKICRKTHEDMTSKIQIDLYASQLHKRGSSAVHRYTFMELRDRFALYNLAFDQEDYRVDKDFNIVD